MDPLKPGADFPMRRMIGKQLKGQMAKMAIGTPQQLSEAGQLMP
jgi:hypothetical protein